MKLKKIMIISLLSIMLVNFPVQSWALEAENNKNQEGLTNGKVLKNQVSDSLPLSSEESEILEEDESQSNEIDYEQNNIDESNLEDSGEPIATDEDESDTNVTVTSQPMNQHFIVSNQQGAMIYRLENNKFIATGETWPSQELLRGTMRFTTGSDGVFLRGETPNGKQSFYLKEADIQLQDTYKKESFYVTVINGNHRVYGDVSRKSYSDLSIKYYKKTFKVIESVKKANLTFYAITKRGSDGKDSYLGYVDARAFQRATHQGGIFQGMRGYATVTSGYRLWKNLNFTQDLGYISKYRGQTLFVHGKYVHYNGAVYYSLLNNKGKWVGYVNKTGVRDAKEAQGMYQPFNRYVSIIKKSHNIYRNFKFQQLTNSTSVYGRTYLVRGYYRHYNGATYYSLQDNKGHWKGYANANTCQIANNAGGVWLSESRKVRVISKSHAFWNNFKWQKRRNSQNYYNKIISVKGKYHHFNGPTYYSVYDGGKWLGYINAGSVRDVPKEKSGAEYLGTSRKRIIETMSRYENNSYYRRTPYKGLTGSTGNPERLLSPYGKPNRYGPGMNCTGFVAAAMRHSGGDLKQITKVGRGWGGPANAYNWRDALVKNSKYYTFSSVNALLKSGKAEKGDILFLDHPRYDCHIGIFWGNNPRHNRFWHQVLAGNKISHIYSGTPYNKIYLFKMH